jgi:ABC-type transport system involved in cytochrome c biogenesis permease subunit
MKRSTGILLAVLFVVGIVVTLAYIYLSLYEIRFFRQAIVIWIIVVIAVIGVLTFEIYDSN